MLPSPGTPGAGMAFFWSRRAVNFAAAAKAKQATGSKDTAKKCLALRRMSRRFQGTKLPKIHSASRAGIRY
ncbi:hypothetical protein TSAR_012907 [Trichomalopsis sarcophagae]|uniref:Uncharacterized protein n=1 Tax=Trichomalopsis sarcophagae TaxID=543379 RepID=A0A232EYJ1_9HYME|nr:hypothetical protein TSAR_012907 [Trichomalopsis sarcophagae]